MKRIEVGGGPAAGGIELGVSREKIMDIIEKARIFDVKEEVSDPDSGSNATDDDMRDLLEDLADDPTRQQLRDLIRSLDVDEQINLVALAWLGRGTYSRSEWNEAIEQARAAHNTHTAEYLMGLPLLGDYLEGGLATFDEAAPTIITKGKRSERKAHRPAARHPKS